MTVSKLEKLTSKYGEHVTDVREKEKVFHVRRPHLLIQACGYLKFSHAQETHSSVYFRGQGSLHHGALSPTIYRGITSQATCAKRNAYMNSYLESCRKQKKVLKQVPGYAWEPLLQHYGIRTRWIDAVDNVWVALWFACHEVHATGPNGMFLHFERRPLFHPDGKENYAYIVLLEVGSNPVHDKPGLTEGMDTEAIDLRVACPSTFLRPHAQHGVLVKRRHSAKKLITDYSDVVAGVVRVSLNDAYTWLGDGVLLSTHVLFRLWVHDYGYRDLLNYAPRPSRAELGSIHHIGA